MSASSRSFVVLLVVTALPAQAVSPETITPEALRRAYLACERAAFAARMDAGGITTCSVIHEALKERVFGGDARRLRAWSDPLLGRGPQAAAAAHIF